MNQDDLASIAEKTRQSEESYDHVVKVCMAAGCLSANSEQVKAQLETRGLPVEQAKVEMVPSTQVRLEDKKAEQMVRLMEAFEDHDDVQNVWANFDIDERILQAS